MKRLFFRRRGRLEEEVKITSLTEKREGLFSIMDNYKAFFERQENDGQKERAKALDSLKKAVNRDRCHIALVGLVKNGKSTLLNALLGDQNNYDLSPVSIVPCTAAVVMYLDSSLRQDGKDKQGAIVHFTDGASISIEREEIPQYVDQADPAFQNERAERIDRVEVYGSFPLIETRGVIVDTPGLGALYDQDEFTTNILSGADVILCHVSVKSFGSEEGDFLARLPPREKEKLMFALTKVDRARTEEDRSKVVSYAQKHIKPILGKMPHLYQVAAEKVLEAYKTGKSREEIEKAKEEWGMKDLEDALLEKIRNRPNAEDRLRSACKELGEFIDDDTNHLNGKEDKIKAQMSEREEKRKALANDRDGAMRVYKQGVEKLKAQWKHAAEQITQDLKKKQMDIAGSMISVVKKEKFLERHKQAKRAKTLWDMLHSCLDEEERNLKSKLKRLIDVCAKELECDLNIDLRIGYNVKMGTDRLTVKTIPGIVERYLQDAAASIEESSGKELESVLPPFRDHHKTLMAVKKEALKLVNREWETLAEDLRAVEQERAELENISGDLTRFLDGL